MVITDETQVITYANKLDIYTFVGIFDQDETAEECLAKAIAFSREGAETCRLNLEGETDEKRREYWKQQIAAYDEDKPQIETYGSYKKRERDEMLSGDPKEITEEKWWDAYEVLPPCGLVINSRYTMFYISEALSGLYHSCYLEDKQTGRYWTKICDVSDRSTWLDVVLGLR